MGQRDMKYAYIHRDGKRIGWFAYENFSIDHYDPEELDVKVSSDGIIIIEILEKNEEE